MLDSMLKYLALVAVIAVSFCAGAVVLYYKLPPYRFISEAIQGGEAWLETLRANDDAPQKAGSGKLKRRAAVYRDKKPVWNTKLALDGYTLLCNEHTTAPILIDMKGAVVHTWNIPFRKAWPRPQHVHNFAKARIFLDKCHMFPNGDLLVQFIGLGDTPYGYGIVKIDKNSDVIWTYSQNAHHDFYIDQHNGDIYALIHKMIKKAPPLMHGLDFPMLVDFVVRLDQNGKELSRLSVLDAFMNSEYASLLYYEKFGKKRANWNHFHTNSIMKLEPDISAAFPLFKAGQVLISLRNSGILAIIDLNEKKVIWAMKGSWKMQHDAKFLPDGSIAMFDNQGLYYNNRRYSRALAIDPANGKPLWYYDGIEKKPLYSTFHGRIQPLPNGNLLIVSSVQEYIVEIDKYRKAVWQYNRPVNARGGIISAERYAKDQVKFLQ